MNISSEPLFPEVGVQYGFTKVPIETIFDIAMYWRVKQVELNVSSAMKRILSVPTPVATNRCPECGAIKS